METAFSKLDVFPGIECKRRCRWWRDTSRAEHTRVQREEQLQRRLVSRCTLEGLQPKRQNRGSHWNRPNRSTDCSKHRTHCERTMISVSFTHLQCAKMFVLTRSSTHTVLLCFEGEASFRVSTNTWLGVAEASAKTSEVAAARLQVLPIHDVPLEKPHLLDLRVPVSQAFLCLGVCSFLQNAAAHFGGMSNRKQRIARSPLRKYLW